MSIQSIDPSISSPRIVSKEQIAALETMYPLYTGMADIMFEKGYWILNTDEHRSS